MKAKLFFKNKEEMVNLISEEEIKDQIDKKIKKYENNQPSINYFLEEYEEIKIDNKTYFFSKENIPLVRNEKKIKKGGLDTFLWFMFFSLIIPFAPVSLEITKFQYTKNLQINREKFYDVKWSEIVACLSIVVPIFCVAKGLVVFYIISVILLNLLFRDAMKETTDWNDLMTYYDVDEYKIIDVLEDDDKEKILSDFSQSRKEKNVSVKNFNTKPNLEKLL